MTNELWRNLEISIGKQVQIDVEILSIHFGRISWRLCMLWAKGSKFDKIMEITPVFGGSLIRAVRRLEKVLQQLILHGVCCISLSVVLPNIQIFFLKLIPHQAMWKVQNCAEINEY